MIPVRALYWPIIDPRELLGTWVRIGVFPVSQYMRIKRGEGVKGQLILELLFAALILQKKQHKNLMN